MVRTTLRIVRMVVKIDRDDISMGRIDIRIERMVLLMVLRIARKVCMILRGS